MKRIIIHSNTLWSLSNFRYDLIKELINLGYAVVCLAPRDDISTLSTSRLRSLNAEIEIIKMDRKGTNPLKDLLYLMSLLRVFLHIKPDVVLNYTPKSNIYSSLACRMLRIPYINTINGLGSGFSSGFPVTTIIKFLYKLALRKSKQVYVQNHDDLEFFQRTGLSPMQISSFIPGSGVNTETYRADDIRNPQPSSLKFLYVGRMIKEKGVYDFIYVAEELKKTYPDCTFWMVGFIDEGNPSSLTLKELNELSASGVIEYKGKTDNIVEYLNASDVMVFPSTYREGLPRTLLEAASCSLPCITYDIPGCREIVIDGYNGFLCRPKDRKQLKEACERFLNMKQNDIIEYGMNGRKLVVSNFSVELVNRHYLSILKKIL